MLYLQITKCAVKKHLHVLAFPTISNLPASFVFHHLIFSVHQHTWYRGQLERIDTSLFLSQGPLSLSKQMKYQHFNFKEIS
jgi:hypothetical protein